MNVIDAVNSSRPSLHTRLSRAWGSLKSSTWAPIMSKVVLGVGALTVLALLGGRVRPSPSVSAEQMAAADLALASTAIARAVVHAPPEPSCGEGNHGPSCGAAAGVTADGKVILNVASAETLDTLPGIGSSRALAIVALREKLGRFKRIEDLLRVRGIGRRSLDKLRPLVVLDAAPPATGAPPPP